MNKRSHAKLICDIGEVSGLFHDALSLDAFLQKTVDMVAEHMKSDVCSIYLYNDQDQELILKATKGLKPAAVGRVRLGLGEGLTGLALKELRPICVSKASKDPAYRFFPEIGEEAYESFLAVPITRGTTRVGAVVIQNAKKNSFSKEDIDTLRAITSQLANIIETTKMLMDLNAMDFFHRRKVFSQELKLVKGKVGSRGIAIGQAALWGEGMVFPGDGGDAPDKIYTLEDFHRAVTATEHQLEEMQKNIETTLSDVASLIFGAQILMLKDQLFIGAIERAIKEDRCSAALAVSRAVQYYTGMFDRLDHAHLREKKQDVKDVGKRLLDNLRGVCDNKAQYKNKVVIAWELLPSEILKMSSQGVVGVIVLSGGVSSHLSILARSLQIPLVISDEDRLVDVAKDVMVILDAEQGNIHVDPSRKILEAFRAKGKEHTKAPKVKIHVREKTFTRDGARVQLFSNINLLNDLKLAQEVKAEGVGLYRTEFPFIVRSDFPSEEEQFLVYRKLVEGFPGQEVTFRTLDIGGDKVLSYYHHVTEENPFLGMRSIRFSLKHKDIFAQQIRAILRAGQGADLRIMFPMISSLDELLEAKAAVHECIEDLKKRKMPRHAAPKIGMMVELPAAIEIIDILAQEADFFSIGTNDFIQYMLAVDRTNEKVAEYFLPEHPAVLRALRRVVESAVKYKKEVNICGDMAHQIRYIPYLLGIGIRKLSLDPYFIPQIQKFIEGLDLSEARAQTEKLFGQSLVRDVLHILERPVNLDGKGDGK